MKEKALKFYKCQNAGNDFLILINKAVESFELPPEKVAQICDRRFGIGADGIIVLTASKRKCDARFRLYNSDGSEAEISGNGLCCAGKALYDTDHVASREISIETPAGYQQLKLQIGDDGKVESVTVKMPLPNFIAGAVPISQKYSDPEAEGAELELKIGSKTVKGTPLKVGNPHFVTLSDSPEKDMIKLGAKLEAHEAFPKNANVHFVKVIDRRNIEVCTHERGAGPTLACGSGSTASVAALARAGLIDFGAEITVNVPGGSLAITAFESGEPPILRGSPKIVAEVVYFAEPSTV